jgi:SAM-dependent methyltransferase
MRIAQGELSDVSRYIENHRHIRLEDKQAAYENYLRQVRRFRPVDASLEMLEIGTGTGWFPLLCKKNGLRCTGMEISPQLVAYAHEFGAAYGIVPDIRVGNIEESPLEKDRYDVIFAMSVFEHVEHWRLGLQRIYDALRPAGLLVFESTNKFSFISGEYSFPLYGWLPDGCRYARPRHYAQWDRFSSIPLPLVAACDAERRISPGTRSPCDNRARPHRQSYEARGNQALRRVPAAGLGGADVHANH